MGQEESVSRVKSMMISRMESCLQQAGPSVSFFKEDKSHMITVLTYDGQGPALESLTELAHRFREQMLAQQGIALTIGIGGQCGDLFGRGRDSYQEAVEVCFFSLFSDGGERHPEFGCCRADPAHALRSAEGGRGVEGSHPDDEERPDPGHAG
ncbi:hypothetical protein LJK88_42735 [Paenibacillus sp. P26]|nr:hypothetical protein LJK88_42735 [Paenibacillus sp. P26]